MCVCEFFIVKSLNCIIQTSGNGYCRHSYKDKIFLTAGFLFGHQPLLFLIGPKLNLAKKFSLLMALSCAFGASFAQNQPSLITQEEAITPFLMNATHCSAYLKDTSAKDGYAQAVKDAGTALEAIGVRDSAGSIRTLCMKTVDFRQYEVKYWVDLASKKAI